MESLIWGLLKKKKICLWDLFIERIFCCGVSCGWGQSRSAAAKVSSLKWIVLIGSVPAWEAQYCLFQNPKSLDFFHIICEVWPTTQFSLQNEHKYLFLGMSRDYFINVALIFKCMASASPRFHGGLGPPNAEKVKMGFCWRLQGRLVSGSEINSVCSSAFWESWGLRTRTEILKSWGKIGKGTKLSPRW